MSIRTCIMFLILALMGANPSSAQNKDLLRTRVLRTIDMWQPYDERHHQLKDETADSTLSEICFFDFRAKKIPVYEDSNFKHFVADKMIVLDKLYSRDIDTIMVVDPTDGTEKLQIVRRCDPMPSTKLRVLEEWAFDPATGKTDIQVLGLAVLKDLYKHDSIVDMLTLFWLKYADIQNILARYNQYHPTNTLAMRIWEDYFLSDIKPGKVK